MASADAAAGGEFMDDARQGQHHHASAPQAFGVLAPSSTLPPDHPGAAGARYYTIQRVNGGRENEGAGGGGGGHRHTLEESDAIKKNSVKRKLLREEKERKKADVSMLWPYFSFSCYAGSGVVANGDFKAVLHIMVVTGTLHHARLEGLYLRERILPA